MKSTICLFFLLLQLDSFCQLNNSVDTVTINKYLEKAATFIEENQFDSASLLLLKSLQLSDDLNYPRGIFAATTNLGVIRFRRAEYDLAHELYQRAYSYAKLNGMTKQVATAAANLGQLKVVTGKPDEGMLQLHEAEQKLTAMNAPVALVSVQINIAECYEYLKDKAKQTSYLDKAEAGCQKLLEDKKFAGKEYKTVMFLLNVVLYYRGNLLINEKKYDTASVIYFRLLRGLKAGGEYRSRVFYENQLCRIYLEKQEFDLALAHNDNSLVALAKDSIAALYADVYELRGKVYEGLKKYDSSLAAFKKFKEFNDNVLDQSMLQKIYDLQAKYETEEKDRQINYLRKEKTLYKWLIAASLIAIIATLFFSMISYRSRKLKKKIFEQTSELHKKEEEASAARLQAQIAELEQKSLRAQMSPHFVFNSLHSIQHYVINRDVSGANKYISMLGALIRQTLNHSSLKEIKLSEELKYITQYLELEKMRMQDKFEYRIQVSEDLHPEEISIPPMLLQPFIENAIRHGIQYLQNNKGFIELLIESINKGIVYSITDNGVGRATTMQFTNEFPKEHQSKGIEISAKRIALLSTKDSKGYFEIIDLKDKSSNAMGTKVIIFIPE